MKHPKLTTKQQAVYEVIRTYINANRKSPYIREIQESCNISSYKGTVDRLVALEKKGYIKRKLNKHRSIALTDRTESTL